MANNLTERKRSAARASGPAGGIWLVQAFSGLLLVALLLLHMIAHHFVVEGGLRDFDQVIDYISNPAIFGITIIFLLVVTAHALLGLRAILLDMSLAPGTVRVVNWVLLVVGIATVVYGIWLEIAIINYG